MSPKIAQPRLYLGQPKVKKVKNFLPYQFMKSPQTKFHADTMRDSKVITSKSQNLSFGQNFLQHRFFSLSIFY